jgi:hypothetical protein
LYSLPLVLMSSSAIVWFMNRDFDWFDAFDPYVAVIILHLAVASPSLSRVRCSADTLSSVSVARHPADFAP